MDLSYRSCCPPPIGLIGVGLAHVAFAAEDLKVGSFKCEARKERLGFDVIDLKGIAHRPRVAAALAVVATAGQNFVPQASPLVG